MKKVFMFAAVALMGASVITSCGPSEAEQKAMADSLAKAMEAGFADAMKGLDSAANAMSTTVDSAAAAATETTTATETK